MAEYIIGHKISLSFYLFLSMLSKAKSIVIVSVQYLGMNSASKQH